MGERGPSKRVLAAPVRLLPLMFGLVVVKGALVFGLGRVAGRGALACLRMAAVLAQAGEFGFVLFNQAPPCAR